MTKKKIHRKRLNMSETSEKNSKKKSGKLKYSGQQYFRKRSNCEIPNFFGRFPIYLDVSDDIFKTR